MSNQFSRQIFAGQISNTYCVSTESWEHEKLSEAEQEQIAITANISSKDARNLEIMFKKNTHKIHKYELGMVSHMLDIF